ncbi:YkgJ family cysteine cluster protein [Maridesulfovibrio sp.]|uniref:YkgJ family cysteine cluster protein n=1 Tax=Maridesulfovibrio sp. TaxID=2795000 RepID=UPI002A1875FD|nr:YkgJ family cysteine cluster protein [Maridesulfovibrio sp.]
MSFLTDFIDFLSALVRRHRLKKNNRMVVIRGSCNMCGNCCRGISLYIDGKWLKKEKQFSKMQGKYSYLRRFEICGRTDSGLLKFRCTCLSNDGTCNDYENRPELCKNFPAPSIYLMDGYLPDGCSFRMSTETDFEKILEHAIKDTAGFKAVPCSDKKKSGFSGS